MSKYNYLTIYWINSLILINLQLNKISIITKYILFYHFILSDTINK